jgi:DNA-binding winged helix-turn-helix (wHTH) protein
VYEFCDFRLDSGRFELLQTGRRVRLERKPMELLILLVSREGQLVSRAEIAERLWSSEVFVDTGSFAICCTTTPTIPISSRR